MLLILMEMLLLSTQQFKMNVMIVIQKLNVLPPSQVDPLPCDVLEDEIVKALAILWRARDHYVLEREQTGQIDKKGAREIIPRDALRIELERAAAREGCRREAEEHVKGEHDLHEDEETAIIRHLAKGDGEGAEHAVGRRGDEERVRPGLVVLEEEVPAALSDVVDEAFQRLFPSYLTDHKR